MMAVPGLVGDVLFGFCKMANSFEMLILGRLIIGFSCGKCICTHTCTHKILLLRLNTIPYLNDKTNNRAFFMLKSSDTTFN